jgi:hypothetical protein
MQEICLTETIWPFGIIWLAVVAVAESATAAPYLAPILINYPTGVVNRANVDWVDYLMVKT